MLKKIILFLLVTVCCLSAQGIFEEASQEEIFSSTSLCYELNGYIRGVIYAGPVPEESGYESKDRYGEAALKLRLRKGRWGDAYSELRFRNINGSEGSLSSLILREAYVNVYLGAFDVRLGQQVVQWGKADGYNPTNIITPMDLLIFSPAEDDSRKNNFLIRGYYNWPRLRLEADWIPVYEPSVLPFKSVQFPEGIHAGDPNYPDEKIENSSIALKLHYEGASIDATISYFNGFVPMPGLAALVENNLLSVYTNAYRIQMIGADFSTTAGSYGLRGEFAYRKPYEEDKRWQSIPKRQIEYILGLDREWGSFSLIVQYIGKYVFDFEELIQVDKKDTNFIRYQVALWNRMLSRQENKISHTIFFRPALKCFHETVGIEVLGMINFITEEIFLKPKLSYDIADDLQVTAGFQIYQGPEDTLFGLLDENRSAGFIELKALF